MTPVQYVTDRRERNMQRKKWYEWIMAVVFIAMVGLCIYLNLFSVQGRDMSSIVVNSAMFFIVALILISCDKKAFTPINRIIYDLQRVTGKIGIVADVLRMSFGLARAAKKKPGRCRKDQK